MGWPGRGSRRVHFLFPSDPIDPRQPDAAFRKQTGEMRKRGFGVSIVPIDDLGESTCKIRGALPVGSTVVYRGWMLDPSQYKALATLIASQGAHPISSLEAYLGCHYLPNWYPLVAEFTAETKTYARTADLGSELKALGWEKFFIKDYVKSLKTSAGSVLSKAEDIEGVLSEMEKFRGTIEGGVCVRHFEDYLPNSERRYFVVGGKAYAAQGSVPQIVLDCARRIKSLFFTVDVATNTHGIDRVVEIGDGQVSDLVGWTPGRFCDLWQGV